MSDPRPKQATLFAPSADVTRCRRPASGRSPRRSSLALIGLALLGGPTVAYAKTVGADECTWQYHIEQADRLTRFGDYAGSIRELQAASAAAESGGWPGARAELVDSLDWTGLMHMKHWQFERAAPVLRRALAISLDVYGEQHRKTATILDHLGSAYARNGRYERANGALQRALRTRVILLGMSHPEVAQSLVSLGDMFSRMENFEAASRNYAMAMRVSERALETDIAFESRLVCGHRFDNHTMTRLEGIRLLNNLALMYARSGAPDAAETIARENLSLIDGWYPADHPERARAYGTLGEIYARSGRTDEAQLEYDEAIRMLAARLEPSHPVLLDLRGRLERLAQR